MIIIGLTGKARSGKDTVAEYLAHRRDMFIHTFSTPMDATWSHLSVFPGQKSKEEIIESLGISEREYKQEFGDWLRQRCGEDVLINVMRYRLNWYLGRGIPEDRFDRHVISDIRTNAEAKYVKEELGGVIWRLERDDAPQVRAHHTEKGIDDDFVDAVIENNGSMVDLYAVVDGLLDELEDG